MKIDRLNLVVVHFYLSDVPYKPFWLRLPTLPNLSIYSKERGVNLILFKGYLIGMH